MLKLKMFTHKVCDICHATSVTPFVLVPGDDLDEVEALQHGLSAIDEGGMRISTKVRLLCSYTLNGHTMHVWS
jgi:hypothetical protein